MQPHRQFFTSLKHLEKRLKLENHPPPPPSSAVPLLPAAATTTQQSDPLGTPIYLNSIGTATNAAEESEAPNEFLSASSDWNSNQPEFNGTVDQPEKSSLDCDVESLMQLLGLSETGGGEGTDDVGCDEGFYGKIVGVKGPKSGKEVERMNGWIEYFLKGEKKEVLGVAHLLLGKAATCAHSSGDDHDLDDDDDGFGFGEFVFPSTIDEFLRNDPPLN